MSDWTSVEPARLAPLVEKLNKLHGIDLFSAESTRLRTQALAFFEDHHLLEAVEFAAHPPMRMHFLLKGSSIVKLDGTRDTLIEAAKKAKRKLTDETVPAYIRFFLSEMMGEDGPFLIVEKTDDMPLHEPGDDLLADLTDKLLPLSVKADDAGFKAEAAILYGQTLYQATITVDQDGAVDLEDETELATNLPTYSTMLL